jgi:hypothetical protein
VFIEEILLKVIAWIRRIEIISLREIDISVP